MIEILIATLLLLAVLPHAQTGRPGEARPLDPGYVFKHPPKTVEPGVPWMWMGCNISKSGITKDPEALKEAGFGRTTVFSLADVTTPWQEKFGTFQGLRSFPGLNPGGNSYGLQQKNRRVA